MNTNSVLDCPEIQDTLFGESQLSKVEANVDPDGPCLCICGCRTQTTKISNSELLSAALWVGGMPSE